MPASRRWSVPHLSVPAGDALLIVPGLLIAALYAVLAGSEGGVAETDWYPATVFVIALLTVVVIGSGRALLALPRSVLLAIALFAAFVLLNYLSIGWADDRGVAWHAANMTLLYFATFALFAVWPWTARAAMIVLCAFGLAIAVVGWVVLSNAAGADDPTTYLIKQRFAEPIGYPNGNAGLFVLAAWPLVLLAARREMPWLLRGVALGAGGALVDLALLSQSRGSLLAGAIVLVGCLLLVPGRVRTLVALATVAGVTALSVPELLDVYEVAGDGGDVGAALSAVRDAVVLSFVALFGLGASAGLIERYADMPQRVAERIARVVAVVAVLVGVAGCAAAVAKIGNPVSYAQDRWEAFKHAEPLTTQTKGDRLTASLDGRSRDEFWSVALGELRSRPLGGMGAGNFAIAYARERRDFEEPEDPHSLPVRIVSQTGIVGGALFLGFLLAAGAAAWRVRRAPDPLRRAVAASALIAFAYFFIHTAADWLFIIPAVGGAAFAWLGMAVGLAAAWRPLGGVALAGGAEPGAGTGAADDERQSRLARMPPRVAIASACLCAVAMLAVVVPPWLSAAAVGEAAATWRTDPADAYGLLERAREFNGLSDRPDLLAGVIASRLGDRARARRSFARAVKRSPKGWYGHQQLGIEEALAGNRRSSLWQLERSVALNPLEETTRFALKEVRAGRAPSPERVRTVLLNRVCSRVPTARVC